MDQKEKSKSTAEQFESILQVDVPQGRDGKHKTIVTRLLREVEQLAEGSALKIHVSKLPDSKENIRAALSRAARQQNLALATSSNDEYLYVWKSSENKNGNGSGNGSRNGS